MKSFYPIIICLLFVTLQGCEQHPHIFCIREEHEFIDGRHLYMAYKDSVYTDSLPEPSRYFFFCPENLHCTVESELTNSLDLEKEKKEGLHRRYVLFFIHRADGRVDTLYDYKRRNEYYLLGYVSGYRYYNNWIIVESKKPGRIVKREDLCNPKNYDEGRVWRIKMQDCTYTGQEKVFNSPVADYWIANRFTTDLYGPFTMNELKSQMKELGIPLPMKLDGLYDRYVYAHTTGNILDPQPKAFYWPRHRSRKGTVIE